MSKFIGRLVKLGVGRESVRGEGAAPTLWMPITEFSFDDKANKAMSEAGVGQIIDSEDALVTTVFAEGDFTGELRTSTVGYILTNLLGSVSSVGPADEAYTHTFTLSNNNSHPSIALTVQDDIETVMHKLVMVDSFELTAELEEIVSMAVGFKSKRSVTSSGTPSYSFENKFIKKHVGVKVAANIAGLAAASTLSLKSLTFTINKNLMYDEVLGTAEPEDILNQQMSVEGELSLNYEDNTWRDYMMNGDKKAMEIAFTNTDATIGSGSTNPSLTFQMPNVHFYEWEPNYALDEIVTQTVSFKAMADLTNSQQAIHLCQLVNGTDSYTT